MSLENKTNIVKDILKDKKVAIGVLNICIENIHNKLNEAKI